VAEGVLLNVAGGAIKAGKLPKMIAALEKLPGVDPAKLGQLAKAVGDKALPLIDGLVKRDVDDVVEKVVPISGRIRIVETDGDVAQFLAKTAKGNVTVITGMVKEGDDLILRGMHIDGPGAGSLGPSAIRDMAKDLGRQQGVKRVIIHGGIRTTGANPGRVPRPITIIVD